MAAYRRVYDSRHLQADYREPGSAVPEPYEYGPPLPFLYQQAVLARVKKSKNSTLLRFLAIFPQRLRIFLNNILRAYCIGRHAT